MGEFMDFKMLCVISVAALLLTVIVRIIPMRPIVRQSFFTMTAVVWLLCLFTYLCRWKYYVLILAVIFAAYYFFYLGRLWSLLSYPGMPKIYFTYMARRLFWVSPLCLAFLFFEEFELGIAIFLCVTGYFILGYSHVFAMRRHEGNPYEESENEKVLESAPVKWTIFSLGLFALLYFFFVRYGSAINLWISQYFMVTP